MGGQMKRSVPRVRPPLLPLAATSARLRNGSSCVHVPETRTRPLRQSGRPEYPPAGTAFGLTRPLLRETLVESRPIDDESLVGAMAHLVDAVSRAPFEVEPPPIDADEFHFGGHL